MSETLLTEEPATNTNQGESSNTPAVPVTPEVQSQSAEADTKAAQPPEEAKTDAPKTEEKAGAPEKYEFKAPEGGEFDSQVLAQFSEVAKELNMPQDAAQKILDKMAPALASRQLEAIKATQAQWVESSKTDKEFGGDALSENLATAQKAMKTFGTPELQELLNASGLGNHPEIIRMFFRAGKAISEDTFVNSDSKSAQKQAKNLANIMYPNLP